MTNGGHEADSSPPKPIDRRPLAVGVSLGTLVVAVVVFLQAGLNRSFGPLDFETARRLALGLWVVAPIAGGLAARGSSSRDLARAAVTVGLVIGLVVALFPTSGTGQYICSITLPDVPIAIGRLGVGGLVGAGMALALFIVGIASQRRLAVLPGIVLAGALNFGASAAAYELFYGGVRCLR